MSCSLMKVNISLSAILIPTELAIRSHAIINAQNSSPSTMRVPIGQLFEVPDRSSCKISIR